MANKPRRSADFPKAAIEALWQGGLFMALFGLGTLPLLLVLISTGQRFGPLWRRRFRVVQPVLLAVAGLLLLSRGLHLDLSLFESAVPAAGADCH